MGGAPPTYGLAGNAAGGGEPPAFGASGVIREPPYGEVAFGGGNGSDGPNDSSGGKVPPLLLGRCGNSSLEVCKYAVIGGRGAVVITDGPSAIVIVDAVRNSPTANQTRHLRLTRPLRVNPEWRAK